MEDNQVRKISSNPNYQKLVARRSSYSWLLSFMMMVVFYGYIILIAFKKGIMATRIGEGVTTWGMPIGLFVIFFTVIITGIYVRRANNEFDELTEKIHKEVL